MTEDNKYDNLFMTVMQQTRDINAFFDATYGFLRRNTDFFADQTAAEKVITSTCAKHFNQYILDQKEKQKKEAEKQARDEARKKEKELAAEKARQLAEQQGPPKAAEQKVEIKKEEQLEKQELKEGEKKDDDNEKPPVGNGGRTDKYIWTQTLEELQIYIPVPAHITSKQLLVKIESNHLLVQIKSEQEPIISGELHEKIQSDDSIWTITDGEIQDYKGKYIHISLEKWTGQMQWWACVIKGHDTINTQKINPEPSKLSDLEGETRGTVEKMMFDMRQKQMGLPSSDELQKKDKLSDFMKAHPEMDFSKCKFN